MPNAFGIAPKLFCSCVIFTACIFVCERKRILALIMLCFPGIFYFSFAIWNLWLHKSNYISWWKRFRLFYTKNLLFLFYTIIFTKHSHQFIYFTRYFNKIFILHQFFIISHNDVAACLVKGETKKVWFILLFIQYK